MSESIYYDLINSSGISPSMAAQIASEIGRRIVAEEYQPGKVIEDEGYLEKRYQVSRSVIRDAIKILVGKGLLETRRGIGTRVRPRSSWGILDNDVLAWHQSITPNKKLLLQLMDLRQIFEPKAAKWAASVATKEEIKEIEKSIKDMDIHQKSTLDFTVADASFHRAILKAAHNDFLIALEGLIYTALLDSIRLTNRTPIQNKKSLIFHQEVYEAIANHDEEKAETLMYSLLNDANQRLKGFFKQKS